MQSMSVEGFANTMECLYPVTLKLRQMGQNIGLDLIQIDEDQRCLGIGTEVMERLISFSQTHNMPIQLTPSGEFGGKLRRLKKFYKRFGFVKNKNRRYYALIRYCN